MNRSTKILLGAATVWPILYMILFFVFVFGMMFLVPQPAEGGPAPWGSELSFAMMGVFVLHFVTILSMLGLTVYYIFHAVKSEALGSDMKAVWIVLFFFGGMIAQPIYWYLNIWRSPEVGESSHLGASPGSAREKSLDDRGVSVPSEPHGWR